MDAITLGDVKMTAKTTDTHQILRIELIHVYRFVWTVFMKREMFFRVNTVVKLEIGPRVYIMTAGRSKIIFQLRFQHGNTHEVWFQQEKS